MIEARRPRTLLALLAAALALVLFPFGWLGELWQPFGLWLGLTFPGTFQHAAGHIALFALLGGLALLAFPPLRQHPWRYLGLLLLVGLAQEGLQALYKGQVYWFDCARDLGTDLLGAGLALLAVQLWPLSQGR
ncbi:MAG TPA: hypothetical protein VFS21_31665 [Roseiflexaceae bacterium]|nr:hypothetical protein [Roseiflexaceae bacterium]